MKASIVGLLAALFLAWSSPGLAGAMDDVNEGVTLQGQGQYQEAVLKYDSALESGELDDDSRAVVLFNRGNAMQMLDNPAQAVSDYAEAIRLRPGDAEFHLNRGNALSRMGEYDEALRDYHTASQYNPRDARIYYNRAVTLEAMGDAEAAAWDYDMARSLDPSLP